MLIIIIIIIIIELIIINYKLFKMDKNYININRKKVLVI